MPLEEVEEEKIVTPHWWGEEDIHSAHRANLLRKDPIYYGKFNWTEKPRMGYIWVDGSERIEYDYEGNSTVSITKESPKQEPLRKINLRPLNIRKRTELELRPLSQRRKKMKNEEKK